MAKGLKGSFFDNASTDSDEEGVVSGFDAADLAIPMGDEDYDEDEVDDEDEEQDEIEEKPKKKSKAQIEEEDDEEEEEYEEEESEESDDEEEDDEPSTLNQVALDLIDKGVLVIDEDKAYEDSEIGIASMIEDTVEARLQERITPGYESIMEAMELGIPASEWVANMQEVAYEDADLDDLGTQKYLISKSLELSGLNKEEIGKKLSRYEKLDTLDDEAAEAQVLLIKSESQRVANYNRVVQQEVADRRKIQDDTIKAINKQIDGSKELNGQFVTAKEQRELKDYINRPVNAKGQTQYMLDRNDPTKLVQIAHLAKNGVNLGKLTKQLESKVTRTIKDKLDSRTDGNTSGKGKQVKERLTSNRMADGGLPWSRSNFDVED